MARGYVYEFMTSARASQLEECDLYEHVGSFADYFADLPEEEQEDCRLGLLETFASAGVETGEEDDTLYIVFTEETRMSYFSRKYERFMSMVKDLTLEDYIANGWQLRQCIEDDCNDIAYLDYPSSMDYFVRNAEIGKKYYLGNVVLAH